MKFRCEKEGREEEEEEEKKKRKKNKFVPTNTSEIDRGEERE